MLQNNQSIPRIIIAFCLLMFGCTPDKSSSEIRKLVFPTACDDACWMGIEPNISTVDEAVEILEKNYGSENVIHNENAAVVTLDAHNATWYDRVSVLYSNNVVNSVSVELSRDGVEVKSFVSEIGNPEDVALIFFGKCTTSSLVYSKKGLIAFLSETGNSAEVSETQTIHELGIYSPRAPNDSKDMKIVPWKGYREYCPERWSGGE